MTLILGLTGGIATGKSTADHFLKQKGIPIIDADQIAHDLYQVGKPAWKEIKDQFGREYLNSDQTINRKKLGQLVFNDQNELELLNKITHPLVHEEINRQIKQEISKKSRLVILDIPLLFESHAEKMCDQVLVITLPEKMQITRLMERNNLTKEQAIARIHSQMPLSEKEVKATYVISNSGTVNDLYEKLDNLLNKIEAEV
ncbi:dephospho-CoA kinase [Lactobacillus agrestimuris]|uniref:dephospho-CoA kinase n=1 Tax=Lactobacillus agrestimuris TaxID=2941328 RepID=UPI00204336BC|nr:dephospho-CoA kinase [Lactobacillus agrestimuris]